MSRRVILNSQGLKVSPPGTDADTVSPGFLQFNSDWSGMALAQSGDFAVTNWNRNGNVGWLSMFVPFNKTYSSPPSVWFYEVKGSYLVPLGTAYGFNLQLTDTSLSNQPRSLSVAARPLTNGIQVEAHFEKQTDGWPTPNPVFRYFVWDYNL